MNVITNLIKYRELNIHQKKLIDLCKINSSEDNSAIVSAIKSIDELHIAFNDESGIIDTFMSLAIKNQKVLVVKNLLLYGFDPNTTYLEKYLPLDLLLQLNENYSDDNEYIDTYIDNCYKIAKLLLDCGADYDAVIENKSLYWHIIEVLKQPKVFIDTIRYGKYFDYLKRLLILIECHRYKRCDFNAYWDNNPILLQFVDDYEIEYGEYCDRNDKYSYYITLNGERIKEYPNNFLQILDDERNEKNKIKEDKPKKTLKLSFGLEPITTELFHMDWVHYYPGGWKLVKNPLKDIPNCVKDYVLNKDKYVNITKLKSDKEKLLFYIQNGLSFYHNDYDGTYDNFDELEYKAILNGCGYCYNKVFKSDLESFINSDKPKLWFESKESRKEHIVALYLTCMYYFKYGERDEFGKYADLLAEVGNYRGLTLKIICHGNSYHYADKESLKAIKKCADNYDAVAQYYYALIIKESNYDEYVKYMFASKDNGYYDAYNEVLLICHQLDFNSELQVLLTNGIEGNMNDRRLDCVLFGLKYKEIVSHGKIEAVLREYLNRAKNNYCILDNNIRR